MEATSREIVNKVARNLSRHMDRSTPQQTLHRSGGVEWAADLLNCLDKETRNTLLARIEERNATLGAAIRKKVFRFEDLIRLTTPDLQRVVREVDAADMAIALKASKENLVAAILGAISKRAAEGMRDEMAMLPAQKPKNIEAAQDRIIQVVRKLEEAEEITLDGGSEE
jgi:flagellar motor switch protein FliG